MGEKEHLHKQCLKKVKPKQQQQWW